MGFNVREGVIILLDNKEDNCHSNKEDLIGINGAVVKFCKEKHKKLHYVAV
jgi:hypothetical protein